MVAAIHLSNIYRAVLNQKIDEAKERLVTAMDERSMSRGQGMILGLREALLLFDEQYRGLDGG